MNNTLKSLVVNLIGSYEPTTFESNSEQIIPAGLSGVDWEWLGSLILFALSFYCVFRLVGVIINAIRR